MFTKLNANAVTPTKAFPYSAGFDLSSSNSCIVPKRGRCLIDTGLSF